MRQMLRVTVIISVLSVLPAIANAQCQNFNEKACDDRLAPFANYGNFVSTQLSGGDKKKINMTFYGGQKYRLAICGLELAEKLHFKIFGQNENLLYSSKQHNYSRSWTFKVEETRKLEIALSLPRSTNSRNGCVAIKKGMPSE